MTLGAAALGLAAAFGAMAALDDLFTGVRSFVLLFVAASAAYGIAAVSVVRRPPQGRRALGGILVAAVAFRLLLLPLAPTLSTDLYRYLWDGRLGAAGVSPYRAAPTAPELAAYRDPVVYPRLNHPDWRTVYPPGAQLLFTGMARVAPASVLGFKLMVLAFDALTIGLLLGWLRSLGRPAGWVLLYAWHPLVVVELAGSGHVDAVVLALTVGALWAAARGREGLAGALLGAGGLVKLYPLLLLPAVWRRRVGRPLAAAVAVVAGGYTLYGREGMAVFGSLGRYLAEEEWNGGARAVLDWILGPLGPAGHGAARLLPLAALAVLAGVVGLRARAVPAWQRAVWLVGAYLLATPNLFPWYALWLVPVLAAAPAWPWLHLTCAVALTYLAFAEPVWAIPAWVVGAEWAPLALGLAVTAWRRGRPGWTGAGRAGAPAPAPDVPGWPRAPVLEEDAR